MERENHCRDCGFDLARLDMTVRYAGKGVDAARRKLRCPVCGNGPVELGAERLAFPRGDGAWVRWREAAVASAPDVIPVGRLRLRIEARVETLTKEQICFRAVPVFLTGGTRAWPALPVMPEYVDCLDPKQVELAQERPERFGTVVHEGGKWRYRCVLPLRGLRETEWPTYECEILPASPSGSAVGELDAFAFRGVSLKVWPNLKRPVREWKYYVVSVGAANEDGLKLFAKPRSFRARMLVPAGQKGDATRYRDVAIDQDVAAEGDAGPTGFVGASSHGRPAWVSLEWHRAGPGGEREAVGGGLFPLRPVSAEAQLSGEWALGIDFGTSNTVVSVRRPDGAVECVAPERGRGRESTTLHLIDGGPQTLQPGMDLWPGGEWAGPYKDLLPSELASVRRWTDVASRDAITDLAFGRDFGIALRGSRAHASPDHVVGEFKWLRAVQKEKPALAHQDVVEALQARYLEAAMLMTLAAQLAESAVAPRVVTVYYSYPLAFEDHDLKTLERAAETAEHRLKALTGADFKFQELMDEAQAAAGPGGSNKMFRVCVDLGGGSLEVLVDDTWARNGKFGHEGLHPHVFSTSLFFGGSVFLRSLIGAGEGDRRGACVMPAMSSYTRLASEVRKWESGRTLIEAPDVITEAKKATAVRRARVFIGYIVELIARVLAGVCLEHGRTPANTLDLSRNRLFAMSTAGGGKRWVLGTPTETGKRRVEFSLVLLGNGWGFADIVRDGKTTVDEMIAQRVRIRLLDLLARAPVAQHISDGEVALSDALGDDPASRLAIEVSYEPEKGVHRKARVACGLLKAQDQPQGALQFDTRANGRHGVMGFDVRLADSGRVIPWYRPFGPPARDRPELVGTTDDGATATATATATPHAGAGAAATPVHGAAVGATALAGPQAHGAMYAPQQAAYGYGPPAGAYPAPGAYPAAAYGAPQGYAPPGYPAPAYAPQPAAPPPPQQAPLEWVVWTLAQQWPHLSMIAPQAGVTPMDYAGRQLWGYVTQCAAAQMQAPDAFLAAQRWEQIRHSSVTPGVAPEQAQWVWQQRLQEVNALAAQRGVTTEALLASQRWSQLMEMLARSVATQAGGGLPPRAPYPTDPAGGGSGW